MGVGDAREELNPSLYSGFKLLFGYHEFEHAVKKLLHHEFKRALKSCPATNANMHKENALLRAL